MTPPVEAEPVTRASGGLEGTAFLVTGGGTGIGRACAAALAADGAAVTICGRTAERLDDAAQRIEAAAGFGGSVQSVVADVTHETSVEALVSKAAGGTGVLNGDVYCGGNLAGDGQEKGNVTTFWQKC